MTVTIVTDRHLFCILRVIFGGFGVTIDRHPTVTDRHLLPPTVTLNKEFPPLFRPTQI
jgi:hypothetical protein